MYFIKVTIKRKIGIAFIEALIYIGLMSILLLLFLMSNGVYLQNYNKVKEYSYNFTGIHEALMYIETQVNKGENIYIENASLVIENNGENNKDMVLKEGNVLYYKYKDKGQGYTKQPLLYNVKSFIVEENRNVMFLKIITEEGVIGEKAMGK